jgi:hypothetical protein
MHYFGERGGIYEKGLAYEGWFARLIINVARHDCGAIRIC